MNKSQEVKIQSGATGEVGRWCVVQTNTHEERTAKFHLERKCFAVYLPLRASLSKRKDAARATPLFPNYLFVDTDVAGFCWGEMFGAIGVRNVLSAGNKPKIAPVGLVEAIKGREEFGLVQLKAGQPTSPHKRGDRVQIIRGPFADYEAIFEEVIDERRVFVLLSLFDARVRTMVNASHLKAP